VADLSAGRACAAGMRVMPATWRSSWVLPRACHPSARKAVRPAARAGLADAAAGRRDPR
jgi:hypothetical protein